MKTRIFGNVEDRVPAGQRCWQLQADVYGGRTLEDFERAQEAWRERRQVEIGGIQEHQVANGKLVVAAVAVGLHTHPLIGRADAAAGVSNAFSQVTGESIGRIASFWGKGG